MAEKTPRRCDMLQHTEAEKAILAAMQVVERMGADVRLTNAVVYLEKAFNSVADFTDGFDGLKKD